jgi:hypothetical protein
MTELTELPWLLLSGMFWLGLSLYLYLTFVVLVIVSTSKRKNSDPTMEMPTYHRLIITIPLFVGIAGTISLLGVAHKLSGVVSIAAFVLGMPVGILLALFMKKRL